MADVRVLLLLVVLMLALHKAHLIPLAASDHPEPSYHVSLDLGPDVSSSRRGGFHNAPLLPPSEGARPTLLALELSTTSGDEDHLTPALTVSTPVLSEESTTSQPQSEDGYIISIPDYEINQPRETLSASHSPRAEQPNPTSPTTQIQSVPVYPDAEQYQLQSGSSFPSPLPHLPDLRSLLVPDQSYPNHPPRPSQPDLSKYPSYPDLLRPSSNQSVPVTLDLERLRPIIPYLDQIIRGIHKPKDEVIPFRPNSGANGSNPILLELYIDVQCPYSEQAYSFLSDLAHLYGPSQVKFKAKIFPMPHRRGSYYIAKAVKAVSKLTEYRKTNAFLTLLFNVKRSLTNEALRTVSDSELIQRLADMAALLGVDRDVFNLLLENATLSNYTQLSWEKAIKRGVTGTPTLLVNGEQMEFQSPLTLPQVLDFMRRLSSVGSAGQGFGSKAPKQPSSAIVMLQERTLVWNSFFPPGNQGTMNEEKATATLYTN